MTCQCFAHYSAIPKAILHQAIKGCIQLGHWPTVVNSAYKYICDRLVFLIPKRTECTLCTMCHSLSKRFSSKLDEKSNNNKSKWKTLLLSVKNSTIIRLNLSLLLCYFAFSKPSLSSQNESKRKYTDGAIFYYKFSHGTKTARCYIISIKMLLLIK